MDDAVFSALDRDAAGEAPITATEIARRYQPTRQEAAEYQRSRAEWQQQRADYEQLRNQLMQNVTMGGIVRQPDPSALRADSPTAKAEALLRKRIGDAEWGLFQTTRTLTRPSRLWPSVLYRVRLGEPVQAIRDGQLAASLCVVTRHWEPEADRLLTILDLIETDERRLWEMANLTHLAAHQPTERRQFWLGLLLIANVVSAVIYWVVRWLR